MNSFLFRMCKTKKIIHLIVGARPNFMKVAPIYNELNKYSNFISRIIHTGQHYDLNMSRIFFKDLNLPTPYINLGVGSGTHAEQTGRVMIAYEKLLIKEEPDLVIVVGDVNSTLACSLASVKLGIPLAHIEAGLRSFDREMPEEINRILTDQVSDFLFTTCEDANLNLKNEGISEDKIFFVGNVMIDSLQNHINKAENSNILEKLGLRKKNSVKKFALVTLHRPSNVDDRDILKGILNALNEIAKRIEVIFIAHPRTLKQIEKNNLSKLVDYQYYNKLSNNESRIRKTIIFPPFNYLDFLNLMSNSTITLTDSGGIQEETTILGIPCLTLRKNTERPITIKEGTNRLVGNNPDKIKEGVFNLLDNYNPQKIKPRLWDGKAASRISNIIYKRRSNNDTGIQTICR